MPFALASVCKPFVPVIFKLRVARFTEPVPELPAVFKLIALIAVFTASPVTTLLSPATTVLDLFNLNTILSVSAVLVISVPSPLIASESPNFFVVLPVLPVNVIGLLRTLLIASTTSPAFAIAFLFGVDALLPASEEIVVVFTLNVTSVPFAVFVTTAVVCVPFLKLTTLLLLILALEALFSNTLKPLLFSTV